MRYLPFGGSLFGALFALHAAAQTPASAQDYPDRTIKLVVGYAPGGGADIMGRLIGQQISEITKQPVVVENRPGAGQNIGASYAARAQPDGYTLFMSSSALAVNISLYPTLDYDPVKDFAPIAVFADSPNLLVVRQALPVKSVAELIAYGKEKPGALNFSSAGSGSTQHLAGEMFKLKTGGNAVHIPYKGTAPSITAVLSGEVDFAFMNIPSAKQYVVGHQLKPLAITSSQRSPVVPDVPTMKEAGVDGMVVSPWYGVLAPAGTPPEIIAKMNKTINQAVQGAQFKRQLIDLGTNPVVQTPEYFKRFLTEDIARWKSVLELAHIKAE